MMIPNSFFAKSVVLLLGFACFIAFIPAVFIYIAAGHLEEYLIESQAKPLAKALVEAEGIARRLDIENYGPLSTDSLAQAVNGKFFVGKQVPDAWRALPTGLTLLDDHGHFVYIIRNEGIIFALSGLSRAFPNFLAALSRIAFCTLFGILAVSVMLGWFISRRLSQPIKILSSHSTLLNSAEFPNYLLERGDEIGQLARSLNQYKQQSKQFLEEEKSFTGDVSHELRTPLSVIISAVELAQDLHPPESLIQPLARIERAAAKMNLVIDSLLYLARRKSHVAAEFEVRGMIEAIIREWHACGNKGEFHLKSHFYKTLICDQNLAEIVFANILRNAAQYSLTGIVDVYLYPTGLEVINSGSIVKEKDSRVNKGNSGLGLSIARRACAKLGWKLEIMEENGYVKVKVNWP